MNGGPCADYLIDIRANFPQEPCSTDPVSSKIVIHFPYIMNGSFLRVLPVEPAIELGSHKGAILDAYYTFLILGGQIGLPIVLLTMFLNGAGSRRHPTLINMLVSWMLYAIANLLLWAASLLFCSVSWLNYCL